MNTRIKSTIRFRYLLDQIKIISADIDKQHAAAAIVAGACMGVVPLLGLTFILVSAYSMVFKLNFIIMQLVHLLVTPLQLLLLYPFLKTGQWILQAHLTLPPVEKLHISYIITHFHTMSHFLLKIVLGGTLAWLIGMLICAPILYIIIIRLLQHKSSVVAAK